MLRFTGLHRLKWFGGLAALVAAAGLLAPPLFIVTCFHSASSTFT